MERNPLPHRKVVFVCVNERPAGERVCCASCGGQAIRDALKAQVKERKLSNTIRVSQSGCMDRCEQGANVMIFPDNVWLSGVTEADVPAILDALIAGLGE